MAAIKVARVLLDFQLWGKVEHSVVFQAMFLLAKRHLAEVVCQQ